MSRYNIKYKGKWACFSSVVDAFITEFMDKYEYEKWRLSEYGDNLVSVECRMKLMKEVAFSIRLNRSHYQAVKCLAECGLSEKECEQIIYDMETEYYVPILKDNDKFECPNCHKEINKKEMICSNDDCCFDFVWR